MGCLRFRYCPPLREMEKGEAKKIEAIKPFAEDCNFQSLNCYDSTVDFCKTGENDQPDIEALLAEKKWAIKSLMRMIKK